MVVIEYAGIELDYCADCMGVWFDEGEIDLLLETAGIDPETHPMEFRNPDGAVTEAKRPCPICDQLMQKQATLNAEVILDSCRHGHGIWFDSGEIVPALRSILKDTVNQGSGAMILSQFLGSALQPDNE